MAEVFGTWIEPMEAFRAWNDTSGDGAMYPRKRGPDHPSVAFVMALELDAVNEGEQCKFGAVRDHRRSTRTRERRRTRGDPGRLDDRRHLEPSRGNPTISGRT